MRSNHALRAPAAAADGPDLAVVRAPRPRHRLRWLLLTVGLLGVSVFSAVSLNALAAQGAVRARALEERVDIAQREHAHLVAVVAALDTPGRIKQVAEQQLGMLPGGAPRLLVLDRTLPTDETADAAATDDLLKPVLAAER